jgi:cell division protein FtsN
MAAFEHEDRSVVEFQLGNKQLFLLFMGLLVICAIFFFIGLRVGEDTAKSRVSLALNENGGQEQSATDQSTEKTLDIRPAKRQQMLEKQSPANMSSSTSANRKRTEEPVASKSTDKPADKPAEKKTTETPVKQPASSKEVAGGWYVQVMASPDLANAEKARKRLPNSMNTAIQQALVKGNVYYRVLIGPYGNKQKAEEIRQTVQSSYKNAFLQHVN